MSLCVSADFTFPLHKGNADFYNSHCNWAIFPQVSWWENKFFSCTEAMLHKRCPASVCLFSAAVLIGFLWKFRLTSRGLLSLDVAWHPVSTCFSVRLIKSLRVSWGCYSSCLDLLMIDSCFANRKCCWVTGDPSQDLQTHAFPRTLDIYSKINAKLQIHDPKTLVKHEWGAAFVFWTDLQYVLFPADSKMVSKFYF